MYDTIVIGAGQAGLAIGYYLKQLNQNFILLDKGRVVGESWKNRYDSLVLFTPRMFSALPGMPLKGEEQGCPTRDEIVTYLKNYAVNFEIPIHFQTEIINVTRSKDHYIIQTTNDEYQAKNIVIATGPFQTPIIPSFSSELSKSVNQLHSSTYKNPKQINEGNVLVVGGGNSGAQIAVELSKDRETYLACSKELRFLPLTVGTKSIFWWFDKLGILNITTSSKMGRFIQKQGDPIFGNELKNAIKQKKVILKPRVTGAIENKVIFEDTSGVEVHNIIWATGFQTKYSWLNINGVLNKDGQVVHQRGVSPIKGLYFIGLPWQYRRGSALLQGVGFDAKYIVSIIHAN